MKHYFETPAEAAQALKFDIDSLIDDWFEKHDIYDDYQRTLIAQAFRKAGFKVFEDELFQYFENHDAYEFDVDDSIIYDDGYNDDDL